MNVYFCRWLNGDFSAVHAASQQQAKFFLDEVEDASGCEIYQVKDFLVTFKLLERPDPSEGVLGFEVESFGCQTFKVFGDMYPELRNVEEQIANEFDHLDVLTDDHLKQMHGLVVEAFARERNRKSRGRVKRRRPRSAQQHDERGGKFAKTRTLLPWRIDSKVSQ